MIIKIKELTKGLYTEAKDEKDNLIPFINPIGDCIDLRAAEDYEFSAPQIDNNNNIRFDEKLIKLGIAMQLPKGYSAIIRQRSSTTKKLRVLMATSGFIDTSYCGNTDEWMFYCFAIDKTTIHKGDRICQFEIKPNQFATIWQKIKWVFSSRIKFKWVNNLNNKPRGGHGKTGVK